MKHLALAVCLTVLVSGIAIRPQTPAKPSPDYNELEAWAGNWTFQGYFKESPSGSASKLDWSWEGRWRPGGRFLEIHGILKVAGNRQSSPMRAGGSRPSTRFPMKQGPSRTLKKELTDF